ncbi:MAG: 2-nitropropane dioxygenase, partial [Desulfobacterales bacterium]
MPLNKMNAKPLGWWQPAKNQPTAGHQALSDGIKRVIHPFFLINCNGKMTVSMEGTATIGNNKPSGSDVMPLIGYAPALHPKDLGDPLFKKAHDLRYAYVVGAMANGITSVEMVEEAGRCGMIGFFGAAGLLTYQIEAAIDLLQDRMGSQSFGMNLIHNPTDPELEAATVDLYIRRGIKLISASAYLDLTLPLVYYRVNGIHRDNNGKVICPGKVIAKVSRVEVARKFLSPPPP